MTAVELTRFRVPADRADALLAARPGMLRAFAEGRPGFLRADLIRVADDEWLDIVLWERSADFAASRVRGADSPEIEAFFASITELVSSEEGSLAEVPS